MQRDLKKARSARARLRSMPTGELMDCCRRAADHFLNGTLPIGLNGATQTADDFVHAQSASTGLPESMCRGNMQKIHFVLTHMESILDALSRGLDLDILAQGYGVESRGVTVSYSALSPILGAVLPSNSPGVHTLWLPAIPLRVGLVLKPGSLEPWTPYRVVAALVAAGVPREVCSLYPGDHDVGNGILTDAPRSMIFGSEQTVRQYAGNPRVQVHGPGFSKVLLGDDVVDRWPEYLDLIVESIFSNGGRSCINCSAVYASRHGREIAEALAERLGPVEVKPPTDPEAGLAAFTQPGVAEAIGKAIDAGIQEEGVTDCTARYGPRLESHPRCAYLRPIIVHCDSPERRIARQEYMFPFAAVVTCPQSDILSAIGPTLVATAITEDEGWTDQLIESTQVDRLNLGPIPTNRLNWLQPHEGNIIDFLYHARALQRAS